MARGACPIVFQIIYGVWYGHPRPREGMDYTRKDDDDVPYYCAAIGERVA